MESIKEILARNCKRLLNRSVNLAEVSRLMQIHPSTISRWKNGDHAPELDKVDRLAEVLDVDPMEFFKTESTEVVVPIKKSLMAIPDEVYQLAPDLSEEAWGMVRVIMRREAKKNKKPAGSSKHA